MTKDFEKPTFIDVQRSTNEKGTELLNLMNPVIKDEAFAVLATNAQNEAYTSLISFVSNDKLTLFAFATPTHTRKYQMITKDPHVSLLIDNRATTDTKLNEIVAITALGKAHILSDEKERKDWAQALINKHHYLEDFIYAPTTAIILVEIEQFYYVSHFQNVIEWDPNNQ